MCATSVLADGGGAKCRLSPPSFSGCCTYFVNPRRLTLRSSGQPPGYRCLPLNSNVRPKSQMPLPFAKSQRSSALPPRCCFSNIQIAALLKRRSCSNSSRGSGRPPTSPFSPRHGRKRGCALPLLDPSSENPRNSWLLRPRSQRSRLRLTRMQTQVQVSMRQAPAVLLRRCSPVTVASVAATCSSGPAPRPNQSIEGTAYGLRPPAAPHIQR
jgi:hypothetical protein